MDGTKCGNCELINLGSDVFCRRCGCELGRKAAYRTAPRIPRQAAKQFSYFYTIVAIGIIGAIAAYFYFGLQQSVNQVTANDNRRLASQANQKAEPLSRTEYDQKRTVPYKNAIQDSHGLAASQKRLEETEKLMAPQGNSAPR